MSDKNFRNKGSKEPRSEGMAHFPVYSILKKHTLEEMKLDEQKVFTKGRSYRAFRVVKWEERQERACCMYVLKERQKFEVLSPEKWN